MRISKFILLGVLIITTLSWFPAQADPDQENDEDTPRLHYVNPEACQQCHAEIYQQWSSSMHSKSSALRDPIHGLFYQGEVGNPRAEGQKHKRSGTYPVCLNCHAPLAALDKKTKLDENPAYENGVGCTTCHSFTAYKGIKKPDGSGVQLGIAAYEIDQKSLHGSSGITYTTQRVAKNSPWPIPVPHPQPIQGNKAALFKSNDVCMGCHDQRSNFNRVALCQTGAEYASVASFVNCQSCHMPRVSITKSDGSVISVFDHSMAGGHDAKMISHGITLDMKTQREANVMKVSISLHNRLPHSFPTGAPFRNVYLKIAAYDKDGKLLWQNYQTHPAKDDPQSFLLYDMGKDGKSVMPPDATEVLSDTRLKPNEVRQFSYNIPMEKKTAIIRAELLYNLLTPVLLENFGSNLPQEVQKPMIAASAEIRL